jgi:hypothetical protein
MAIETSERKLRVAATGTNKQQQLVDKYKRLEHLME